MKNEKRLIDAEAVRHKINAFAASVVYRGNAEMFNGKDTCNPHEYTRGYERGILDAQKIVCGEETVSAVEVVHAEWLDGYGVCDNKKSYISIDCSNCGEYFKIPGIDEDIEEWKKRFAYCPFCGAKMDGGNEK